MNERNNNTLEEAIIKAEEISHDLKIIANPLRLITLCTLAKGSKNVSELMKITGSPQTMMSNHLSVLRKAGIIDYQREHRTLNYFIKDERVVGLLSSLCQYYSD